MVTKIVKLYDLVNSRSPDSIYKEISAVSSLMEMDPILPSFQCVYEDIVRLFNGRYPGYRASNTKYHDLEHTLMVTLATVRLVHGCIIAGFVFQPENILTCLLAALFHDAGLIQTTGDQSGTGAKYTIIHEMRSVDFMRKNLGPKQFSETRMSDCEQMIKCTNLRIKVRDIDFRSDEIRNLGKIVGSADLLAQMADRHYLEKLLLLFKEFEEAGLPGFESEDELLEKTEGFYKNVALKRLERDLGNVAAHMKHHFIIRWKIDQDLYQDAIANNIHFLTELLGRGKKDKGFYRKLLKRRVIG